MNSLASQQRPTTLPGSERCLVNMGKSKVQSNSEKMTRYDPSTSRLVFKSGNTWNTLKYCSIGQLIDKTSFLPTRSRGYGWERPEPTAVWRRSLKEIRFDFDRLTCRREPRWSGRTHSAYNVTTAPQLINSYLIFRHAVGPSNGRSVCCKPPVS